MRKRFFRWLLVIAVLLVGYSLWTQRFGVPEDFEDLASEYKYGSMGSDHPFAMAPIPYWIWKVLPQVVAPVDAIEKGRGPRNGKTGFDAFGLVTEANMPAPDGFKPGQPVFGRPIGFSKRTVFGVDFVGVNCAFCHLTTIRNTEQAPQQIVLGGTGNTINIEQYFLYMFGAMGSDRFTASAVMDAVAKETAKQNLQLGFFERVVYRIAIWAIPKVLASRKEAYFDFIAADKEHRLLEFGPGRVDTWAVYKRLYADPPEKTLVQGIVDFPAVWNQKARVGMRMHWDGNTDVLEERNIVSALAVIGHNIDYLDFPRLNRIADYLTSLLPPRYEDRIPEEFRHERLQPMPDAAKQRIRPELASKGEDLFQHRCASCHAPDGLRLGRVEPIEDLGTDAERLKDFSPQLAKGLNQLETKAWKMRNFKTQQGYVNSLLDGIWLRAPYLHNGSVPTLRDLLNAVEKRPEKFCRGSDVYDWKNVGFMSAIGQDTGRGGCGSYFTYDTTALGNSNYGHLYGSDLSAEEKEALLEFLKTL